MNGKSTLTGAILWASAILAAATVGAPQLLWLILLPSLAAIALVTGSRLQSPSC